MSNIDISENLLDEIRAALASPASVNRDKLTSMATQYDSACTALNKRLRKIGSLLAKGLRSEAIQLADQEPNVLEQVALLDFPERDYWCDLLRRIGSPTPPPLEMDIAEQVDEAYAVQWPLDQLLRKHRLLAIARAPLVIRLQILRRIREKDPTNPAWVSDQQNWEKTRIKEIERDLKAAVQTGDSAWIQKASSEINNERWEIGLPVSLVEAANQAALDAEITKARAQLKNLNLELNNALSAFDVATGQQVRQQWQTYANMARLAQNDPLFQDAAEALAWLDDENSRQEEESEFDGLVYSLEQAIERNASPQEVEKLVYSIRAMEREVPEILLLRASEYQRGRETSKQRKFVLGLVVAMMILIGIGVAVIFFITYALNQQTLDQAVADLKQFQSAQDYSAANGFIENLPESVSNDPRVAAEITKIQEVIRKKEQRVADFNEQFDSVLAISLDEPDLNALKAAEELAEGDAEFAKVNKMKADIDQRQIALQKVRNEKFLEQLGLLQQAVTETPLETSSVSRLRSIRSDCEKLRSESQGFMFGFPRVDLSLVQQLDPIMSRAQQKVVQIKQKQTEMERLNSLVYVGDTETFSRNIARFSKDYPENPLSADFAKSALEKGQLEGYLQWQKLFEDVPWERISSMTPLKAEQFLDKGKMLATNYPDLAIASLWREKSLYLNAISKRVKKDDDESILMIEELLGLFREPHIAGGFVAVDSETKIRYLMPKMPSNWERSQKPTIEYYSNLDLIRDKRTLTPKEKKNIEIYKSPQSYTAAQVVKELNLMRDGKRDWEGGFARILYYVSQPLPNEKLSMDPILRINLIKKIIDDASLGSPVFAKTFSKEKRRLRDTGIDLTADWVRPDPNVDQTRGRALTFINLELQFSQEVLDSRNRSMQEELTKLKVNPIQEIEVIGWVTQENGNWVLKTNGALQTKDTELLVIAADSENNVSLQKVGDLVGANAKWSSEEFLQSGRFVLAAKLAENK